MNKLEQYAPVPKYDPDLRDEHGRFLQDDWISASDVGGMFLGKELSLERYNAVELAYTSTVLSFLEEAKIDFLQVSDIEYRMNSHDAPQKGSRLRRENIPAVVGAMLREEFWCRLESTQAFVHVGYDYYMYIGVTYECPNSINFARQHGIFVENFISPHHPDPEY